MCHRVSLRQVLKIPKEESGAVNRRQTSIAMVKLKKKEKRQQWSTKCYTENKRPSNTNPTKTRVFLLQTSNNKSRFYDNVIKFPARLYSKCF